MGSAGRPHIVFAIFLHLFTGVLTFFFGMFMFVRAEYYSSLILRVSGLREAFASPAFFRYLSLIICILAVLIVASAIIHSMIHFEPRTIFVKNVIARSRDYARRIDDRAKEALTFIVILALAYTMLGSTLKPLLGEVYWLHFTTVFLVTLGFAALLAIIILITRKSMAYLVAMYEVHRELSRGPLMEIPEVEEV